MSHSRNSGLIERSLKIGAFAGAPLNGSSVLQDLDDLDSNDITLAMFVDELKMYSKIAEGGLKTFLEGYEEAMGPRKEADTDRTATDEGSARQGAAGDNAEEVEDDVPVLPSGNGDDSLGTHLKLLTYLFPFYIHRLSKLGDHLARMAEICMRTTTSENNSQPALVDDLRRLKQMVTNGKRPQDMDPDIFDMTDGNQWEIPDLRYPAPSSGPNIPGSNSYGGSMNSGGKTLRWRQSVDCGTLDSMKRDGLDSIESGNISKEGSSFSRCKQRHPTGYTKFNFSPYKDLDFTPTDDQEELDGGATTGSVRFSSRGSSQRSNPHRRDSVGDDLSDKDSCSNLSRGRLQSQRSSSFTDSPPYVIDDAQADPNWQEESRTQARQRRVRQRIPTGHPNMMKNAMLARLSIDNGCEVTKRNTELNSGT